MQISFTFISLVPTYQRMNQYLMNYFILFDSQIKPFLSLYPKKNKIIARRSFGLIFGLLLSMKITYYTSYNIKLIPSMNIVNFASKHPTVLLT